MSKEKRSNFYRDSYHIVLNLLFVEIAIIFILIGCVMYCIFTQQTPPNYATMLGGKILPLVSAK